MISTPDMSNCDVEVEVFESMLSDRRLQIYKFCEGGCFLITGSQSVVFRSAASVPSWNLLENVNFGTQQQIHRIENSMGRVQLSIF